MDTGDPPSKRRCLETSREIYQDHQNSLQLHCQIEECYASKCLCDIREKDLQKYVSLSLSRVSQWQNGSAESENSSCVLFLSFLTWLCQTFHEELSSGLVCSAIHSISAFILDSDQIKEVPNLLKSEEDTIRMSAVQALVNLLPLYHCGFDGQSTGSSALVQQILKESFSEAAESRAHQGDRGRSELSAADALAGMDAASLDFDDFFGGGFSSHAAVNQQSALYSQLSDSLKHKSALVSVLTGLVAHSESSRDDAASGDRPKEGNCEKTELGEDVLCQETEIKYMVMKMMEPNWLKFTRHLEEVLTHHSNTITGQVYLSEGFKLWENLLSVRGNLSFSKSRVFSQGLTSCVASLSLECPASVWRSVLDCVSECLCYGTTLALQSIPPQEPCDIAHTIIRLVRFNKFLSQVPCRRGDLGALSGDTSEDFDRGLVQKVVLLVLKCVALTTREARVDSSSGESDSSASSRESTASGNSDMVIIERTMSGMYRVLDGWIKDTLPVLPEQNLQDSLLHILQEQDDVLIEGLLCLLDTHTSLYSAGRPGPDTGPLDTNPTRGFLHLVNIVARDSSVLLDFLVSNETCFLLYFLRFLKFVNKDWSTFSRTCDTKYSETVEMLLDLKLSIKRLLSKSLFPYNIGPIYRLLEKVQDLHSSADSNTYF